MLVEIFTFSERNVYQSLSQEKKATSRYVLTRDFQGFMIGCRMRSGVGAQICDRFMTLSVELLLRMRFKTADIEALWEAY